MKKQKIIFWTTTAIFSLSMIISASTYLISESVKAGFSAHLGIPDYLRIELAVAKIGINGIVASVCTKRIQVFQLLRLCY